MNSIKFDDCDDIADTFTMHLYCSDDENEFTDALNEHGHSFKICGFCKRLRTNCVNFIRYGYDCQYLRPTVKNTFIRSPNISYNNMFKMYKIGPCLCISQNDCNCESVEDTLCSCVIL
jgi:hypothetical protein